MGVEYSHGIYVEDLHWRPAWQHVEAVRAVLARYGFTPMDPELYVLGDAAEEIEDDAVPEEMPDNVMAVYEGPEGEAVTRVMGPSLYEEVTDEDRYIQSVTVIFGVDFKVLFSETIDAEVIEPPRLGNAIIETSEARASYSPFSHVYPATWATTPPLTRSRTVFPGVWRCGITIDCGKDVPAIGEAEAPLPCPLVRELEAVLGTSLVEQGWFY
ncbi:MAG TPA: hypothetical protein VIV11_22715 [Kofleriaceae bacterium]